MNDQQQPAPIPPTMAGYVTRIVLQILRDARTPLSNSQIEQAAAHYYMDVKTAHGIVRAGGHAITDTRTTIRRLIQNGYNIKKEWRQNQFGNRYKVYWLEEQPTDSRQTSLFGEGNI